MNSDSQLIVGMVIQTVKIKTAVDWTEQGEKNLTYGAMGVDMVFNFNDLVRGRAGMVWYLHCQPTPNWQPVNFFNISTR